ncbi:MAG: hypothetical protein J7M05_00060 [Anaerolineae bacterium]|nr:hypothetical protein [Anaerolineae bacterium]
MVSTAYAFASWKSSGSPTGVEEALQDMPTPAQIDQTRWTIQLVTEMYDEIDPQALTFLREHPQLAELVLHTAPALRTFFDPEAPLSLELVRDPETGEEELFALVHLRDTSPQEALEKLRRFDEEWFLTHTSAAEPFNVDVAFL